MNSYHLSEVARIAQSVVNVGVVTGLDVQNASVKVEVMGVETDWIPWVTIRAGATRTWSAPRVGEQGVVLAPFGDLGQAVFLPGLYRDLNPPPSTNQDLEVTQFPDGSTVVYDSANNKLTVNVNGSGDVEVNCKKVQINTQTATVEASGSVTVDSPTSTFTGALTVQGPFSFLAGCTGSGGSGGASMSISGEVAFSGGSLTHNGMNIGSTHTHGNVSTGTDSSGGVN